MTALIFYGMDQRPPIRSLTRLHPRISHVKSIRRARRPRLVNLVRQERRKYWDSFCQVNLVVALRARGPARLGADAGPRIRGGRGRFAGLCWPAHSFYTTTGKNLSMCAMR
jgi:hypothetical protein